MRLSKSTSIDVALPRVTTELAAWFAEGVRSEVAALEKQGVSQRYELLSGRLIQSTRTDQAIFQFVIADGTRIPEDASGQLRAGANEYGAKVIGQQGNALQVSVEGSDIPREGIPRAILSIDDTALLRKLAEFLDGVSDNSRSLTSKALLTFHPDNANVGFAKLANTPSLVRVTGAVRRVLEQASGSEVTYIWGPPGTGKTYCIAHLLTAMIESGKRVLVTSHTHAAVDQILYESIKTDAPEGPLASHSAVAHGEIIRIGATADPKIPDSVRLDKVVALRARDINARVADIERKIAPLLEDRMQILQVIAEWNKLDELENRIQEIQQQIIVNSANAFKAEKDITDGENSLRIRREELKRAQQAWLRRATKTKRAMSALANAELSLRMKEAERDAVTETLSRSKSVLLDLQSAVAKQVTLCDELRNRKTVEHDLLALNERLRPQEQEFKHSKSHLKIFSKKSSTPRRLSFAP